MPLDSNQIAEATPTQRSRVTNGSALLPNIDGRSSWARRCRDVLALHVSDLGGDEAVSEAERSICRRAAVLTTELELLEARFAQSGEVLARRTWTCISAPPVTSEGYWKASACGAVSVT